MDNTTIIDYSILRFHNQDELVFDVIRAPIASKRISIYAPGLMKLIWSTQHSMTQQIDIGIYTRTGNNFAIYQTILIEMYYNYIFQMKQNLAEYKYFEFKVLIATDPCDQGVVKKSLNKVMRVIPDFAKRYSHLLLVDHSCNQWDNEIPEEMRQSADNVDILAIKTQRFRLFPDGGLSYDDQHFREKIIFHLFKMKVMSQVQDGLKSLHVFAQSAEDDQFISWIDWDLTAAMY